MRTRAAQHTQILKPGMVSIWNDKSNHEVCTQSQAHEVQLTSCKSRQYATRVHKLTDDMSMPATLP